MRYSEKTSWTVALNFGGEILFALYVRDLLDISPDRAARIPRLTPAVTPLSRPSLDNVVLAQQWDQWWDGLTASRATSPATVVSPSPLPDAIRDRETELRSSYADWTTVQREERKRSGQADTRDVVPVQEVVDQVQRELGRDELHFQLAIEEVPVEGSYWQPLAPGTVLASTTILHSPHVATELSSVIRELASR